MIIAARLTGSMPRARPKHIRKDTGTNQKREAPEGLLLFFGYVNDDDKFKCALALSDAPVKV